MNILREDVRSQAMDGVGGEERGGPPPHAPKGGHGHRSNQRSRSPATMRPRRINYVIAQNAVVKWGLEESNK